MTREERIEYSKAMNVIEYKIIGRRDAQMPTDEQMNAIMLAVGSMQRRMEEKGLPLRKHIAVLQYHINEPRATIFKDRNTLDALSHGILAMKWMVGTDNYDINGVQI
jgi:preprotein translocase subunit SecA